MSDPTPSEATESERFKAWWKTGVHGWSTEEICAEHALAKETWEKQDAHYIPLLAQRDAENLTLRSKLEKAEKVIEAARKLDDKYGEMTCDETWAFENALKAYDSSSKATLDDSKTGEKEEL